MGFQSQFRPETFTRSPVTQVVTFNVTAGLKLALAALVLPSGTEYVPTETIYDVAAQRASLKFVDVLPAGTQAILRVAFEGALTDSMAGYYKSTWRKASIH